MKLEVYLRAEGAAGGLASKAGLLCVLAMPETGIPLRDEILVLPGRLVGEAESLMAFFRVTERVSVWVDDDQRADAEARLSAGWVHVVRVPASEL